MIITNLLCNKDIDTSKITDISFYIKKVTAVKQHHGNINMQKDATTVLNVLKELYPEYFI